MPFDAGALDGCDGLVGVLFGGCGDPLDDGLFGGCGDPPGVGALDSPVVGWPDGVGLAGLPFAPGVL